MNLQAVGHGFLRLAQKFDVFLHKLLHRRAVHHHDELERLRFVQRHETGLGGNVQRGNLMTLEQRFLLVSWQPG